MTIENCSDPSLLANTANANTLKRMKETASTPPPPIPSRNTGPPPPVPGVCNSISSENSNLNLSHFIDKSNSGKSIDSNLKSLLAKKTCTELEEHTQFQNRQRYKTWQPVKDVNSSQHIQSILLTGFDTKKCEKEEMTVFNIQITRTDPETKKQNIRYIFRTFDQLSDLAKTVESNLTANNNNSNSNSNVSFAFDLPTFPAKKEKPISSFINNITSTNSAKSTTFSSSRLAMKKFRMQRINHYFEQMLSLPLPPPNPQSTNSVTLLSLAASIQEFDDFFRQTVEDIDDEVFYLKLANKSGIDLLASA